MYRSLLFTLSLVSFISFHAFAQENVSLSIGSGYENHYWYDLDADDPTGDGNATASKSDWHLAFEGSLFSGAVYANHVNGVEVFYAGEASNFGSAIDTTNLDTEYQVLYNQEDSWTRGALNSTGDSSDPFDTGWGYYNFTTHVTSGDELFLIRFADGTVKQLVVESLIQTVYTVKHADVDGSNVVTLTVDKSDYVGKNFGYLNLLTGEFNDFEPASSSWDLLFTQYIGFVGQDGLTPYPVSGVLANTLNNVKVAKAYPVDEAFADYNDFTLESTVNGIGYDWKYYDFSVGWVIEDSTVYFVETYDVDQQDTTQNIYKITFTGFGGSAVGNFDFDKELVYSQLITDTKVAVAQDAILDMAPNPARGFSNITYVGSGDQEILNVFDLNGRVMQSISLPRAVGLTSYQLDVSGLTKGTYLVQLRTQDAITTRRLVVTQ